MSEKDNNEQNITMDEFIGAVALVRLEIAKGNTDLAASEIEHLFEAIGKEDTTVDYDAEVVKEIAKWYLTLYCSADKVEECVGRFTEQVPELEGYICMGDAEYEEAEPYKEYKILSIGGEPTGISCYTGGVAEVTWQNEGYETTEPYKEFERKYVNDKATDEIRYTGRVAQVTWINEGYESNEPYREFERKYVNGKSTEEKRYTGRTKPKKIVEEHTYSTCPYCGYSAEADPANHPKHSFYRVGNFGRRQNSDGSWVFFSE